MQPSGCDWSRFSDVCPRPVRHQRLDFDETYLRPINAMTYNSRNCVCQLGTKMADKLLFITIATRQALQKLGDQVAPLF